MSISSRLGHSARFRLSVLFTLIALFANGAGSRLGAQDTRTVNEPVFPATCATLAAQQTIANGLPTSETSFDTPTIQTALNSCAVGKAVELTVGGTGGINNAFLIKPLNIPTGVTLIVDGGVTVFASRNPADYQSTATGAEACGTVGVAGNGCLPLISINSNNTSTGAGIMGYGVINGRGGEKLLVNGVTQTSSWWDLANQANTGNAAQNNPILLLAKKAANFTLYKISLLNSPMFHVKYQNASGFTVWGVKIVAPYTARNTDGIDPTDNVSNITINNSYISDGDDMVAVGANGNGNSASNITISNTQTYSGHGISIGSYTSGGVSNMLVTNVNMAGNLSDSNAGGLKIKSAQDRGGLVNNIQYSNICIQNERYPLQFNPIYNNNPGTSYPSFTNIGLQKISITANNNQNFSQVQLQGLDANHPTGVTFDNLNISNGFAVTPQAHYINIMLGPGPVTPTQLQSLTGPGITYSGNITNPSEARYNCPAGNYPFLAGELYLSSTTLNNQRTLSLPNPATFTLNAVVEPVESASVSPTSPIQFFEGKVQVGTATLSANGTLASLTLSGISSGAHTYTARYPTDTAYAQLNFGSVTVNVNTTATTTTMSATPTSAVYGQTVNLTATVTQASGTVVPSGTVSFQSGSTVIGTSTLSASGIATFAATSLNVGNNAVSAFYAGSTNFAASDSSATPVNVAIAQAGTSTSVTATPASAVYGSTITLTATVNSKTTGVPTGTVTFMDGATILGTAILSNNNATLTTTSLATGAHKITAVYGGDSNFISSTSATGAQVTIFTATTTTQLGFTSGSVPFGSPVTMVGTINNGTATSATGTVTFTDGLTTLAVVTIPAGSGSASYTTSSLTVGTHNIVASYSGDGNYTGSSSTATPLVVTQSATSTTLSATKSTITYGSSDSFTATVSPAGSGTPTGNVTFMDGSVALGTQPLAGGTATLSVATLNGGSHNITAVYAGDANFTASTSPAVAVTVTAAISTTTLTAPASITYGGAASLSATITSTAAGTPTGTVSFMDGTTILGTGALSGGTATFSATGLTGGSHSITAVYGGDANFATSTSAASTLTVNKASTTSTISANPTSTTFGGSTTLTASVTSSSATGTFTFLDGGVSLGTGTISGGVTTLTTSKLSTAAHTLTATYSGDINYATSTTATAATVTVSQAVSTVTLAANPTTINYLGSTVLTATVPAAATGVVTFKDGTTTLGTGTIASGSATFTAATLTGGSHSITAVYAGDTNFTGSTSAAVAVQVNLAAVTAAVVASPTTLAYGSTTSLTATLSNTGGTGTFTFKDGATTLGTVAVASGTATYNATALTGGTHSITAVYSGDTNFATTTTAAITVTVTTAATTTGLVANPAIITFGGSTTLTATVSNASATGTVTFKEGATVIGTGAVSNGVASAVASSLAGGAHSIIAIYSGDTNYAPSTSGATVVTVNTAATAISLAANPSTTTFGSLVTLTAGALPSGSTGTVTFKDGNTVIGTATVASGAASLTLSTLSTAIHSITATYSGDSNYAVSTSAVVTVTVNQVTPTVTVVASPSSITFGNSTTLTATIVPALATGTITFRDNVNGVLGQATIVNGAASISVTTLTGGNHSITATYSGDTNNTTATSAPAAVSVGLLATTTALTASATTLNYGVTTTFSASVAPTAVTGSIVFRDGSVVLGTVPANNGAATLSVSTLTVGSHSITATYLGDTNDGASTSAATTVTVALAPTTSTIAATPTTGSYGNPTTITVTIAPAGATGTVTISDGSNVIGTPIVSGGVATLSLNLLTGSHILSASYSGDANYAASATTTSVSVTIAVANTTVTASGTPAATALGFATTLSATVTPAAATGTVTFRDTGTGLALGTATLSGGTASVSGILLSPAGSHGITATYSGDSNDGGSTSAVAIVTITPGASAITLANTPASPVTYGTSITFATSNTSVLGIVPTGTVQYFDGTTLLGSAPVTLNAGNVPVSTFSFAALMPGTHSVTAVYSGDANYGTSTSAAVSITVTQSNSTLTLVATPPQTVPGQTFTLTATAASLTTGIPTGTVTFFDQNNVNLGTVTLVNGAASITQNLTALGSYTYTATYSGDVDFNASSTFATPTTVSVKQLLSSTTISASPTSGVFGAGTYSVSATVTPSSGGPATGSVTFKDGLTILGTVALPASNTVSLNGFSLAGGVHNLIAIYSGDAVYTSSDTSASPAVITVATAGSATSVSATPATSTFGTTVTFSSAVTNSTGTVATGKVTFMNGAAVLGVGTLNSAGIASFSTSTLAIGTYNVTAVYAGDTNFAGSTSALSKVVVNQIAQTITLSSIPSTLTYGAAPIVINTTASSGLAVTLAVTGPATLNGTTLLINGAGTITVTATQAGSTTYSAAPTVTSSISVARAPVSVTQINRTIGYGAAIPTLTGTLAGVVNGDNITVSYSTTATTSSNPGTYPITATLVDPTNRLVNYTVTNPGATLTISASAQTITFPPVATSAVYGAAPVTLAATSTANLIVTYTVTGPATLIGSRLTFTGAGTVVVTASQPGNAVYSAATSVSQTITIAKAPLTVTVANQSIAAGAALPTLTGTIAGVVNGDAITAVYATTATATSGPGSYPITATLVDPTNRLANYTVTNTPGTLTIAIVAQTITFPTIPASVTYGAAPVTLAATASAGLPVTYTVTGPATLSGSTLTLTGAGTVVVTATQAGNANFTAATPVAQTITVAKANLTVTVANASRLFGVANPTLTGVITGLVNGDVVTATYATTATVASPLGTYPIAATLVDAANRLGNYNVTNTAGTLTITAASTTVTLAVSPATIYVNGTVTLSATVASAAGAPASGTVTFTNGTTTIATATATNGVATATVNNLAVGSYSVTATFAATGNYLGSTSAAVALTVVQPYALSLAPSNVTVGPGATGTSTLTVTPAGGFTGAVTLSCNSPVAYVTCTITNPVTITGTSPVTASVTVSVPATYGSLLVPQLGPERGPGMATYAALLPFGALLLLPFVRNRRALLNHKGMRLLALLLVALGTTLAMTGCGSSGSVSPHLPPPGAQTVTITAVAGGVTQTTTLTVNVTN